MIRHYWNCTCKTAAYLRARAFEKNSVKGYIAAAIAAAAVAAPWCYAVFLMSALLVLYPDPSSGPAADS